MQVNHPGEYPYDQVDLVGVAIKRINESQNHIGILYKDDNAEPAVLLDLAWHHFLRNKILTSKTYAWLDCGLDIYNKAVLAAYCKDIFYTNSSEGIPYGIDVSGQCFDPVTGKWESDSLEDGLTCSTFVMKVFAAQGHIILNENTWIERDTDVEWQKNIISALKETGADQKHIEHQLKLVGAFRYRPEEVAGAVPQEDYPVVFDDAVIYAEEIVKAIQ